MDGDAGLESEKEKNKTGSMATIGKILAVMDMESHDVKMESI